MTLNITIASTNWIHQSADFRLSGLQLTPNGSNIPIADNSPKLVNIQYFSWSGFLTYCGIGKWANKSTYKFASEWICSLGEEASFQEVSQIIEAKGSMWIDEIQDQMGKFQPHSFVLAGFEKGKPIISIISNTHSTKGSIPRVYKSGLRSSMVSDLRTHVFITGIDSSVTKSERKLLKKLTNNGIESNFIRHQLAKINQTASLRPEANNGISESCLCYSLNSNGSGAGETYGQIKGTLLPLTITSGVNVEDWFKLQRMVGSQAQLRGATFSTSNGSAKEAAEHVECKLDLQNHLDPSIKCAIDLSQINTRHIEILSANSLHVIAGNLRQPIASLPEAFIWKPNEEPVRLPNTGEPWSEAKAINKSNTVVGATLTKDRQWVATAWRENAPPLTLGTLAGNNSVANALNDSETVVGVFYCNPTPESGPYHRAFMWDESNGMRHIPGTETKWSNSQGINNYGEIIGWYGEGNERISYIWSEAEGMREIGGSAGRGFFAVQINDSGTIIGEANNQLGQRQGLIWSKRSGFKWINAPFSFHPVSIDELGNVVGVSHDPSVSRAWLYTAQEKLIPLSAERQHSTDVRCVIAGAIYGHARMQSNWKHVHPIRWEF